MPDRRPPTLTRRGVLGAAAGTAATVAAGAALSAPAQADPVPADHHEAPATDPALPKEEFRAGWIATTVNIDWPSRAGLDAETQKEEFLRRLADAKEYHFNAVVTQIRPTADAFWPSPFEPWSRWLTGTQGQDPGYDPLAFAVEQAHAHDLELHAWLNPYRISMKATTGDVGTDLSKLHPDHPARQHPEWVVAYPANETGQLYYNPGIPEVREFVIDAMMDAVDNYDVDGVHFDDYFYPYRVAGHEFDDDAAFAEYGGDFTDKGDWRRNNTDQLIQGFASRIKESKPWVKFGVSPAGVWRNKADDPEGSDTQAGAPTYDALFADTRKWVREGWIDYIAPQIYWARSLPVASYTVIANWWNDVCEGTDCHLYIGEAVYKVDVDTISPEWKNDPRELHSHVALSRELPAIGGNIYYNASAVRDDKLSAMSIIRDEHYARPAFVPHSAHLPSRAPSAPRILDVCHEDGQWTIEWTNRSRRDGINATAWYGVYTTVGNPDEGDLADASNLIGVLAAGSDRTRTFTWAGEYDSKRRFVVTGLNRAWREGAPAVSRRPRRRH